MSNTGKRVVAGSAAELTPTQDEAWRTFSTAARLLLEELDRGMHGDTGLSLSYCDVLGQLAEAPGRALRMAELATASRMSRSRLSHAVDSLERRGLVTRRDFSLDGRGHLAVLTSDGLQALEVARAWRAGRVRQCLFDGLDDAQVGQLQEISDAVLRNLAGSRRRPIAET
jgi:DNA-binding MarR family transcriptional regulator